MALPGQAAAALSSKPRIRPRPADPHSALQPAQGYWATAHNQRCFQRTSITAAAIHIAARPSRATGAARAWREEKT